MKQAIVFEVESRRSSVMGCATRARAHLDGTAMLRSMAGEDRVVGVWSVPVW